MGKVKVMDKFTGQYTQSISIVYSKYPFVFKMKEKDYFHEKHRYQNLVMLLEYWMDRLD